MKIYTIKKKKIINAIKWFKEDEKLFKDNLYNPILELALKSSADRVSTYMQEEYKDFDDTTNFNYVIKY